MPGIRCAVAAVKALVVLAIFAILAVLCILNRIGEKTYCHHVMLYVDMLLCALLTQNPDMTLSARCGLYCRRDPPFFWYALGRALEALQRGHLEMAVAADRARAEEALKRLT